MFPCVPHPTKLASALVFLALNPHCRECIWGDNSSLLRAMLWKSQPTLLMGLFYLRGQHLQVMENELLHFSLEVYYMTVFCQVQMSLLRRHGQKFPTDMCSPRVRYVCHQGVAFWYNSAPIWAESTQECFTPTLGTWVLPFSHFNPLTEV